MEADTTYPSKFSDIKSGKWYSNNVAYLESFSILSGYKDGTFKPNNKITRAEFATMINNFAKPADVSGVKQFSDIKANHWAKPYIDNAVALKWMSGYPDGTFGPDKYITRAEVVSVVNKLIERTPNKADIDSKGQRYKDLTKGFWAYYDVLEASTDRTVFAKKN
jgi:cell surface glycoprotein 1